MNPTLESGGLRGTSTLYTYVNCDLACLDIWTNACDGVRIVETNPLSYKYIIKFLREILWYTSITGMMM